MKLCIDFETRSRSNLKKEGSHKYAADPSTEPMCLSVKVDDKPSRIWCPDYWKNLLARSPYAVPSQISAAEIHQLVDKAEEVEAHNCCFEQVIWREVMHKRYGWPDLDAKKLRCSAARAAMCSLPRSLGEACAVLGLPQQKDDIGRLVMMRMCSPHKGRKAKCGECLGTGKDFIDELCTVCDGTGKLVGEETWNESLSDYVLLCKYCLQDTDAEYALSQALPPLPPRELEIFQLDMQMNNYGVRLDRRATQAWIGEIAKAEKDLMAEWKKLTNGAVLSPKQVQKTLAYFKSEFNLTLDDLTKSSVADALETLAEVETPI